jgi:CrcB protein
MVVNVVGSFALGFVLMWLQSLAPSPQIRQLVAIGFLGSFTTFSTFSYEAVALLRSDQLVRAGAYALGSVTTGLIAVIAGAALAGLLVQSRG